MICWKENGKLGAYAMKRVAAGAHLSTSWIFEPAKRPDDRADYCLESPGENLMLKSGHVWVIFVPSNSVSEV